MEPSLSCNLSTFHASMTAAEAVFFVAWQLVMAAASGPG